LRASADLDRELERIRWRCRRGMLELDLVLNRFQEQHLASLSATEREAFKGLLELPDNELWSLTRGAIPLPGNVPKRLGKLLRAV
jgi:antitoxin CptB